MSTSRMALAVFQPSMHRLWSRLVQCTSAARWSKMNTRIGISWKVSRLFNTETKNTTTTANFAESVETTHFGFRSVPVTEKAALVGEVFHRVAEKYDLMNDVMSAGVHRLWKDEFVNKLGPLPGIRVLDVAGGTGDIAFRVVEAIRNKSPPYLTPNPTRKSTVIVCDINPSMLAVGQERAKSRGMLTPRPGGDEIELSFMVGDAEKLPIQNASIDAYTIAFGIRNCTSVPTVLAEAHRVLRRGGRFMCLEFSRVHLPVLREAYDVYSFELLPVLGELVAGEMNAYKYLVESIRKFPDQDTFKGMIETAGFRMVTYENLFGGIAAIHSGIKL